MSTTYRMSTESECANAIVFLLTPGTYMLIWRGLVCDDTSGCSPNVGASYISGVVVPVTAGGDLRNGDSEQDLFTRNSKMPVYTGFDERTYIETL